MPPLHSVISRKRNMHPVPYKHPVPNKCLPLSTCTWMSQNSKFYKMHEDILLANNSLISYQSTRHVNQCDWKKAHLKGEKNFYTSFSYPASQPKLTEWPFSMFCSLAIKQSLTRMLSGLMSAWIIPVFFKSFRARNNCWLYERTAL